MHAAEFGVELESAVTSMKGVQARKGAMVDSLRRLHLDRHRSSGAELIMGGHASSAKKNGRCRVG
jgi:hypothetical protein